MKHDVDGGVYLRSQNNRASRPSVFERFVRARNIGQCVGLRLVYRRQKSGNVKVCGCRPDEGGAAHIGPRTQTFTEADLP